MQKIFRISFALLVCALAGCSSTVPELPPVTPAVEPVRQASAAEIRQRCARFKALFAPLPVREIGFSHRSFDGFSPEKVCRFAADAGFNRICLFIASAAELDERFSAFLKAAAAEKLAVDVMLRQEDFTAKHRGSSLMKSVDDRLADLAEICRKIGSFNRNLPEKTARVDQVIVAVSPHKFVSDTRDNAGQIFAWSEKNAGPGLDNDMLMLEALELLNKLDTCGMKLAAGVPDFYHELAAQGKLSKGRMIDFCSVRKGNTPVYLLSGGSKPSQVVSGSREEFRSVDRKQNIVLEIELAGHTSSASGKLRRRDWRDLEKILGYVIREHQKYPAFRGIMLTPLPILKYLIMEQD